MIRGAAARRVRAALRAAVIAGAVAAPLLTWASLDAGREQRLDALAQARTEEAASTLERDLRLRLAAIERWARRWERVGVPGREEFDAEAGDLIRDMPGFRALSYNDPGSIARYVVPSANSKALGRNIAELSPDRRRALEAARDERRVAFTTPIQLVDGSGAGFLIFTPVHDGGGFQGTIGIVFHLAPGRGTSCSRTLPRPSRPASTSASISTARRCSRRRASRPRRPRTSPPSRTPLRVTP